jgi:SMC interacting uncharacterized protein involved in chromosome segregation
VLALCSACAGSRLEPTLVSSADATGYALRYPQALDGAAAAFESDQKQAHELSAGLAARADELKPGTESELLMRVVDEADAAGRRQSFARARADDRALRTFFEQERGAIGARVASAAQKQVNEAGCEKEVDTQGSVNYALRDAVDRQLERRLRAENEAQRTLELHKARLPAPTLAAMQRLADEIAEASQLVNVTLVEDVKELDRLLAERSDADGALERAIDDERAIQAEPRRASEQKASQARVLEIEKSRAAIAPSGERAERSIASYEQQLATARSEYDSALTELKRKLEQKRQAEPPKPAPAAPK